MERSLLLTLAGIAFSCTSAASEPEIFVKASFGFGGTTPAPMSSSLGIRQWNQPLNDYVNLSTFTANSETGYAINLVNVPLAVKPVVVRAGEESVGSWITSISTTALVVGGVVAVAAIASVSGGSDNGLPRGKNGESTTTCGIGGTGTDPDIDTNCPAE